MKYPKLLPLAAYAFVGWMLCAATMGIGMATVPLQAALLTHAVAAPIIFLVVSYFYFRRQDSERPLLVATLFVSLVVLVDFFLVALVINKSLAMFESFVGTWLPFGLIFLSTYLTGLLAHGK